MNDFYSRQLTILESNIEEQKKTILYLESEVARLQGELHKADKTISEYFSLFQMIVTAHAIQQEMKQNKIYVEAGHDYEQEW